MTPIGKNALIFLGGVLFGTAGVKMLASRDVKPDDEIIVSAGSMIPFDGTVSCGEATVNQSTLTGEGVPVSRAAGATVYAGTVIEEGELTIRVTQNAGSTRYDKIVSMIEETEKLKSGAESKAEHLADRLVPFTFIGTVLVWLLTRNVIKALSSADVGVAISNGAAIAREIADVTISENDLGSMLTLRKLSTAMMKRIHRNYRSIISINSGLIILGVSGLVQPTATAMLHNASTLGIGLMSTKKLL